MSNQHHVGLPRSRCWSAMIWEACFRVFRAANCFTRDEHKRSICDRAEVHRSRDWVVLHYGMWLPPYLVAFCPLWVSLASGWEAGDGAFSDSEEFAFLKKSPFHEEKLFNTWKSEEPRCTATAPKMSGENFSLSLLWPQLSLLFASKTFGWLSVWSQPEKELVLI